MRAWTVAELNNLVQVLQPLVGTRLQEVQTHDNDLVLGFYSNQGLLWVWIDLNPVRPTLLPWTRLPARIKNAKSPLNLFLRAHFVDRQVVAIRTDPSEGRVIHLQFIDSLGATANIEIRLFPHGRNVIAQAAKKQIAWQKITELAVSQVDEMDLRMPMRSLEQLREQWLAARKLTNAQGATTSNPMDKVKSEVARKEKALSKVKEELQRKRAQPWRELGDYLKTHQTLNVKAEWEPFVDKRRKLSWNIGQAYQKARELEQKQKGTIERQLKLEAELSALQAALAAGKPLPASEGKVAALAVRDLQVSGRTLKINHELTLIAGKNAEDNLRLLRKARAWDLWLHLRDFPSRHAILFKNKSTMVTDAQLRDAAEWLVKQHFGQKISQHAGERIQVLVAECRHVHPIKGDRIGRVTYQNEKVLIHQISK